MPGKTAARPFKNKRLAQAFEFRFERIQAMDDGLKVKRKLGHTLCLLSMSEGRMVSYGNYT
jgi:hypothetical protein